MKGCVFAPYFCSDEMRAPRFGAIHKVFGASNFSKLLMHLPVEHRDNAVVSVLYEAETRLQDRVYGCVSHIYALQQQVANLKGKLAAGYAQLADCSHSDASSLKRAHDQYDQQSEMPSLTSNSNSSSPSPSDEHYLNAWGVRQQIPLDNVAINNYNEEAGDDKGLWSTHPVSTAQETHVFQNGERFSEQRHLDNNENGDLEDLVLAILRRNR